MMLPTPVAAKVVPAALSVPGPPAPVDGGRRRSEWPADPPFIVTVSPAAKLAVPLTVRSRWAWTQDRDVGPDAQGAAGGDGEAAGKDVAEAGRKVDAEGVEGEGAGADGAWR